MQVSMYGCMQISVYGKYLYMCTCMGEWALPLFHRFQTFFTSHLQQSRNIAKHSNVMFIIPTVMHDMCVYMHVALCTAWPKKLPLLPVKIETRNYVIPGRSLKHNGSRKVTLTVSPEWPQGVDVPWKCLFPGHLETFPQPTP